MTVTRPARINVIAVVIATTAALFGRSWLQVELLQDGWQKDYAADLSYLVVPVILLMLLFPVLRKDRAFLKRQFQRTDFSLRVVLSALIVGLLIRALWWGQLVAGISFGFYRNDDAQAIEGPQFWFHCGAPHVVILGFLIMAMMVPVIEEVTHRAYIQSAFHRRGPVLAVLVSAFVFAVFHPPTSWLFSFVGGIVFGIQFWNSGSLWPSTISHATVNALIQVDWRCLHGRWNPSTSELPLWQSGIPATLIIVLSIAGIVWLIGKKKHRDE